jgi:mannose-6-phosphate isomerase-like protein (cupin superfamily)
MGGIGVQFKIDGQQTSGRVSVVEHPVAPGAFALPHTHAREDEISYVLEGRIAAEIDGREMMVEEGEYLLKPRGLKHAFWNPTDHPARLMEIIAPAGLEQFFRIMATLRPMPGSADYDRAMALLAESAVQTHFEERDAFLARHGLSASVPGRTGSLAETAVESRD